MIDINELTMLLSQQQEVDSCVYKKSNLYFNYSCCLKNKILTSDCGGQCLNTFQNIQQTRHQSVGGCGINYFHVLQGSSQPADPSKNFFKNAKVPSFPCILNSFESLINFYETFLPDLLST